MKRESMQGSARPRKKQKQDEVKEEPKSEADLLDLLEAETEPVQYHCDYCRKDISNSVRISCAICTEFDLCLECFSVGVELRGHKNNHDYRVIDDMHFPFLTRDWSAEEEQLLLEGLELYGIGNWADVSDHVSTKDKASCREHYEKYYLSSPTWPEPDYSHLLCTREKVKLLNSGKYNKIKRKDGIVVKKEATPKPKQGAKNKQNKSALHATSPVHQELNGFMPLRDEFEFEWDNDCELKIKDLAILEEDSKEDVKKKMKILEIHNQRLYFRKKWREFVVSRNLHDKNIQGKLIRNRSKEQKLVHKKLKKFLQILEPDEYEEFILGLAREKQLKSRISLLQEYRSLGIRTTNEIKDYEEEKLYRSMPKNSKSRKSTIKHPILNGNPAAEPLTHNEKELCSQLHILPNEYLFLKEYLLREYVKNSELPPSKIEQFSELGLYIPFPIAETLFSF